IRLGRNNEPQVTGDEAAFELGKADVLKNGKDLSIISTGFILSNVLDAAAELEKDGHSVRVVHMHTVKPLDREAVVRCADETGAVLTVEEHSIIGGLGSAVAEVLAEEGRGNVPFARLGIKDAFISVNAGYRELQKELGLDVEGIKRSIKALVKG
ncbi:hypothetical protein KAR91_46195, partial [Candidatus Pacearchaeota archaeon]|nr:hypothetical protein [Candidatus Pacearchaeota archaeon]